jgi:hypothetical protein
MSGSVSRIVMRSRNGSGRVCPVNFMAVAVRWRQRLPDSWRGAAMPEALSRAQAYTQRTLERAFAVGAGQKIPARS